MLQPRTFRALGPISSRVAGGWARAPAAARGSAAACGLTLAGSTGHACGSCFTSLRDGLALPGEPLQVLPYLLGARLAHLEIAADTAHPGHLALARSAAYRSAAAWP